MERCATHGRLQGQTPRGEFRPGPRTIRYRTTSSFLAEYKALLSHRTVFLNTRHPLPVGTLVRVTLSCEESGFRLSLRGRVIRSYSYGNLTNDAPGMFVELIDGGAGGLQRLEGIARSLRHERSPGSISP